MEILLSSGFLAFARHIGFRKAFVEQGGMVTGICGTSSGSVVGALWASGISEEKMCELLHVPRPISKMRPNWFFWQGLFRMDALIETLSDHLPDNIEDLPIPFGVGVMTSKTQSKVLTKGPLVPAIAASCSIPYVFKPIVIEGVPYADGGFVDRIHAKAWKEIRPEGVYLAHIVDRSNGAADEVGLEDVNIIRTPRSYASFISMGDFQLHIQEAYDLSIRHLSKN
jgi:predicted acylesterase/phospholipase RssA